LPSWIRRSGKIGSVGLSGQPAECVAVASRHPALAEVLQVETTAQSEKADVPGPHVTFGHFRLGLQQMSTDKPCGRIQAIVARALRSNPDGVILFSSRSCSRVEEVVEALDAIEGQCAPR